MGDPSRPTSPPEPAEAPHYYKLGDAARIIGVAPSAIRYWQAEFAAFVRPVRTKAGQHVFSRRDVRALGLIRHLLHVDGLSAREARDRLPGLLEAEDVLAAGSTEAEQGILDLAAPPARQAPAGPSKAEADELRKRLEAIERERDALAARAERADRERQVAQSRVDDVSRERDLARRDLAATRSRLDALHRELRDLLADVQADPS
jgi:DNA-binding transcriptional MerR regulator